MKALTVAASLGLALACVGVAAQDRAPQFPAEQIKKQLCDLPRHAHAQSAGRDRPADFSARCPRALCRFGDVRQAQHAVMGRRAQTRRRGSAVGVCRCGRARELTLRRTGGQVALSAKAPALDGPMKQVVVSIRILRYRAVAATLSKNWITRVGAVSSVCPSGSTSQYSAFGRHSSRYLAAEVA